MTSPNTIPCEYSPIVGIYAKISTVCVLVLDLVALYFATTSYFSTIYILATVLLSVRNKKYQSFGTKVFGAVVWSACLAIMIVAPIIFGIAIVMVRAVQWSVRNARNGRHEVNVMILVLALLLFAPNTAGKLGQRGEELLAFGPGERRHTSHNHGRRRDQRSPTRQRTVLPSRENCCLVAALHSLFQNPNINNMFMERSYLARKAVMHLHDGHPIFGYSPLQTLAAVSVAHRVTRSREKVLVVVANPDARTFQVLAEVRPNLIHYSYNDAELSCPVMVFITRVVPWVRNFDGNVDLGFQGGGHLFLAPNLQTLINQQQDYTVRYDFFGSATARLGAQQTIQGICAEICQDWTPLVEDAYSLPQHNPPVSTNSTNVRTESRLTTYLQAAAAPKPQPKPAPAAQPARPPQLDIAAALGLEPVTAQEPTAPVQPRPPAHVFVEGPDRHVANLSMAYRPRNQLRIVDMVDREHVMVVVEEQAAREQPATVEESEIEISDFGPRNQQEERAVRLATLYPPYNIRMVEGMAYVDLQTHSENRSIANPSYLLPTAEPHSENPTAHMSYIRFQTQVPTALSQEAFAPLANFFPVYVLGAPIPHYFGRLITPMLRLLKAPNSRLPTPVPLIANIQGTPVVMELASPPQVRTAVLNGKHYLVTGPMQEPNQFSVICRHWHWYRLLFSRSVTALQRFTYLNIKFWAPHWVTVDDRIVNHHEFNFRWSSPHQTPAVLVWPSVMSFLLIRALSKCFVSWSVALAKHAWMAITTSHHHYEIWKQLLRELVPLSALSKFKQLDIKEPKWNQFGLTTPFRGFLRATRAYTRARERINDTVPILPSLERPFMERWFDRLLHLATCRTPNVVIRDWLTGQRSPPIPTFDRLQIMQLKYACGIRRSGLPLWTRATGPQIRTAIRLALHQARLSCKNIRAQTDFQPQLEATKQVLRDYRTPIMLVSAVTLVAFFFACLRRKNSYFYPNRRSERVMFYGCGPGNPSLSYLMAAKSGKRNFHMLPTPLPPALHNNIVTKRVDIRGVTCSYTPMELVDQAGAFQGHRYTYYWKQVGNATDPVTGQALHVVEAASTAGSVTYQPVMQDAFVLTLRGLPPPQVIMIPGMGAAPPEQYFRFQYLETSSGVVRPVEVKTVDFQNKLTQLEAVLVGRKFPADAIAAAKAGNSEPLLAELSNREARLYSCISFGSCGAVTAATAAGEKIIHEYLAEALKSRTAYLELVYSNRFEADFELMRQLKGVATRVEGQILEEEEDRVYPLAFAPFRPTVFQKYGDLELENLRTQHKRDKKKMRRKPKGEALEEDSCQEPANVDFRCRACNKRPPRKFRWYWQMCPSCFEEMRGDLNEDAYYQPEVTAPFPEGVHALGAPNRNRPVYPKFKEKPTIPEYTRDFKIGRLRDCGETPLDRSRGPQAVGVVTNIRCTVFNALGAGRDHFGPGEPGLVRNRIFKAPTYVATALAWQTARRNLYHPDSFLMQQLDKWKEAQEIAWIQPYRFSDPESTKHAVEQGWIEADLAQEVERYLDEFDAYHSPHREPNRYQDGRGWVASFEPARQREIWEEAAELVTHGINKRHSKCKLFMKLEKAPNCADFKSRPAANPRCIISFSNVTQLLAGRYTRAVTTLLHDMFSPHDNFSYAGGMRPEQLDAWLESEVDGQTMQLKRDVCIAMSDYSAFDTTQRKVVLDFWHQFLSHVGVPVFPTASQLNLEDSERPFPSTKEYLGWIFKAWSAPVGTTTRRNRLKGPYMNCSGRGDTAAMNFFLNFSTQYLAYLIVLTGHYGPYSPEEYAYVNNNLKFIALGDDSLVFVPKRTMTGGTWTFADLQTAVSFFGFEFSEGKVTTDPRDIIFLGMRPWPAKEIVSEVPGKTLVVDVVAWAPVLGRYLQKMGWRLEANGDPYAWWKGIAKAAEKCFPHLQVVNDISARTMEILGHHTQSPIWDRELRESKYKIYYVEREARLLPDDDRAIPLLHYLYNIDRRELELIRSDIKQIKTFPVVLSNFWLERAMEREAS